MTLAPIVSVLMSVHNGDKYLRESVDSILAQTFRDFEFIIIDDGSTDHSLEILEAYAHADLRIRLLTRPNRGLTQSLNEGLALVRGDYVARMDSDDISLPDRFEKQVAFLRAHDECCLVGSRVEFIDPEGLPINLKPGMLTEHADIDAALLRKGWPIVHPSIMMRYDTVMKVGGYSEAYQTNQDHDLFLRLAEEERVANLSDVLLKYRQHFGSVSLSKSKLQGDTVETIVREAHKRRGMAMSNGALSARPKVMTELDYHRNWAWTALAAGNVKTARKHAMASFYQRPFSPGVWRMMYLCDAREVRGTSTTNGHE